METEIPDVLYHYCSIETFLKIIESRIIRLCDMCKSNDAMETKWLIRQANDIITPIINSDRSHSRRTQNRHTVVANPIDRLDNMLQNTMIKSTKMQEFLNQPIKGSFEIKSSTIDLTKSFIDNYNEILISGELRKNIVEYLDQAINEASSIAWAMCFSSIPDSLSQWRGYGDDGTGMMIGFSSSYLASITAKNLLTDEYQIGLSKVEYPRTDSEFMEILKLYHVDDTASDLEKIKICIQALRRAQHLPPIYKHPSFSEEKEWRIFFMINDPTNVWYNEEQIIGDSSYFAGKFKMMPKSFFSRKNQIVSYVPFEIQDIGAAIKRICIGPKAKITIGDIKHILVQYGLVKSMDDKSIEIFLSQSTYQ